MNRALLISIVLAGFAACDKPAPAPETTSADQPANKPAVSVTVAAPTPPPSAPVAISDSDISTPADFAEAAEKSITPKTYKQELAMLQTEIDKE